MKDVNKALFNRAYEFLHKKPMEGSNVQDGDVLLYLYFLLKEIHDVARQDGYNLGYKHCLANVASDSSC